MEKVRKINKKGFTLTEMLLVIAIIAILASVVSIAIATYLQSSRNAQAKVDGDINTLKNSVTTRTTKLMGYGF